jgi:molecular chaperone GrpE
MPNPIHANKASVRRSAIVIQEDNEIHSEDEQPIEIETVEKDVDAATQEEGEALSEALQQAESRMTEYRDEALRARAELDNVRKRSAREIEKARRFALERILGDLIEVSDSLERGLVAAEAEEATVQSLREGTELIARQFGAVLDKHGLTAVDPKGERFDPNVHEAISALPSEEHQSNTVIEVVQKGYCLHDRVLRPARVIVAA